MIHGLLGNLRIRLLALILLILVPSLSLILYTTTSEWTGEKEHAEADALLAVKVAASRHQQLLDETRSFLLTLSYMPQLQSENHSECNALLATLRESYPHYAGIGAAGPDGNMFCSSFPWVGPVNVSDKEFFREAVESGRPFLKNYPPGTLADGHLVVFAQPALDSNRELKAVMIAGIDLSSFDRFTDPSRLPPGADFAIIDSGGTVLVRFPDPEKLVGGKMPDSPLVRTILEKKQGVAEVPGLDGTPRIYGFMPLAGSSAGGAYIGMGLPVPVAYREAWEAIPRGLIAVFALVLVFSAWLIGDRLILRGIGRVKQTADSLAAGDLSVRTGVASPREDIADLMGSIDRMAEALDRQHRDLRNSEEALKKLNQTLLTLGECNQVLVRAASEAELIESICRVLVETGGYRLAWVGFAGKGEGGGVSCRAMAVQEEKWEGWAATVSADLEKTRFNADSGSEEIRVLRRASSAGARRGGAPGDESPSAISLPLVDDGGAAFGCLAIYSAHPGAFDDEEVTLLRELSEDLAYGVINLRTKVQRDVAQRAAEHANVELRQIFETAADGMCVIDRECNVLRVNETFARLIGIEKENAAGRKCRELAGGARCLTPECTLAKILDGRERVEYEDEITRPDGMKLQCLVSATAFRSPEDGLIGMVLNLKDMSAVKDSRMELQKTLESLRSAMEGTIGAMAFTVESRDPYTSGHQKKVSDIACAIAREMNLPEDTVEGIRMAGLIHDIGKIAVPAEILSKPGRINEHEFALIRNHAQIGFDILKAIEFPWPVAAIVHQHHERMDGSGYPQKLSGDEIILEARIIAVADVIEAIASHRPYRAGLGIQVAMEEIEKNRGRFYDPSVVDACAGLHASGRLTALVGC